MMMQTEHNSSRATAGRSELGMR